MDPTAAAERLALGLVETERKRRRNVFGAEVLEIDGLVLALSNLPDPALNAIVVEREPADPAAALARAHDAFADRNLSLGIDLQVGRHPALDRAVREAGLRPIVERPGMAVLLASLQDVAAPDGIAIRPVRDAVDAAALVRADLAWLHPDEMARTMYESLGFRQVARWEVWVES